MSAEAVLTFLETTAEWTWRTSLSASVVAIAVWLVDVAFGKFLPARARYLLWWLVLLRLILPFAPESEFSLFNLARSPRNIQVPVHTRDFIPMSLQTPVFTAPIQPGPRTIRWSSAIALGWIVGTLGFLGAAIFEQHRLTRWIKRRDPLPRPDIEELLAQCKAESGVRKNVSLVFSDVVASPAVLGFFRPKLLLPTSLPNTVSREEFRLVLLHELAHVKRGDVLQNWLLLAVNAAHWFNPIIWLAFRRLRAEREILCDRVVLKRVEPPMRQVYGGALIRILELASKSRPASPLVSILPHKRNIERRLHMITNYKPVSVLGIVASAIIVAAVGLCTLTSAADKPSPKAAATPMKAPKSSDSKRLEVLHRQLDEITSLMHEQEAKVNMLKEELRISILEEADHGRPEPSVLRQMESARVQSIREHQRLVTLITALTNLSRNEICDVLMTAAPDELLKMLLDRRNISEQRLSELDQSQGPDHPDVKTARKTHKQIEQQINERIEGILRGLQVKARTEQAAADQLGKSMAEARHADIDNAIRQRPYWKAKRELENIQEMRDRLWNRTLQERIDSALGETEQAP